MKPDGPVARAREYQVQDCPFKVAASFIKRHHYARGCANTAVFSHGLYRGDALVGVALWMPPTKVCAMTVHSEWKRVLALSRLAVAATEPLNAASILIGGSIRQICKTGKWTALVTFADESQNHVGTIYRATNWKYVGRTKPEPRWEDSEGKQVSRKATKTRTAAQMRDLGYRMVGRFSKHKFVLGLAA